MDNDDLKDALAAGCRINTQRKSHSIRDGDPYPDDEKIMRFHSQVVAMLQDLDGSMTISEFRDLLDEFEP